jgi:hypothetical protein
MTRLATPTPIPGLVALLRAMRPELPDDPEPHQVEAWVELAELVQDPDFRASVRRMADEAYAHLDGLGHAWPSATSAPENLGPGERPY